MLFRNFAFYKLFVNMQIKSSNRTNLLALPFLAVQLFFSCNGTPDLKPYYYQLEDFQQPKYYVFETNEYPANTQYWKISADIASNTLTTETFNSRFEQIEYFSEKFDEEGSKLLNFYPVEKGTNGSSEIKNPDVFRWKPDGEFTYSATIHDKNGIVEFSKTRKYIGTENIHIMGEDLTAAKFEGRYQLKNKVSSEPDVEFWQYGYYTKEYGFVKYERHFSDGSIRSREVTAIFNEKEWQKLQQ